MKKYMVTIYGDDENKENDLTTIIYGETPAEAKKKCRERYVDFEGSRLSCCLLSSREGQSLLEERAAEVSERHNYDSVDRGRDVTLLYFEKEDMFFQKYDSEEEFFADA